MSEFRKGQRVRVTLEGEVCSVAADWIDVRYPFRDRMSRGAFTPSTVTVEPVEDLRPGDVYRTADGLVALYSHEDKNFNFSDSGRAWTIAASPAWWASDKDIRRPLTLLVRDGQPVIS